MTILFCVPIVFLIVSVAFSIRAVKRGKNKPGGRYAAHCVPRRLHRHLCSADDRFRCPRRQRTGGSPCYYL